MNIVAVTACPTGIAHTYMAAEKLEKVAKTLGYKIKVETQGAMGMENDLSQSEIDQADAIILATDIAIEGAERFEGKKALRIPVQEAIKNAEKIFAQIKSESAR